MINSVNPLPMVQTANIQGTNRNVTNPQQQAYNPVQNTNLNGVEALAAYNKPYASTAPKKMQPLMPTIMQPEAIKYLMQKGTPVKSSSGELNSIIVQNDKTTTVYTMDVLAPNDAIRKIETFDNSTGKLVQKQENHNILEEGKLPQTPDIEITKYDLQTGEPVAHTFYEKGKPYSTMEHDKLPDGTERTYIYRFEDKNITIIDSNENQKMSQRTEFSSDGKLKEISTRNWETHTTEITKYKDGHIIGEKEVRQLLPIPNTTGKDPINDPEMKPSAPVIINYDPTKVEGEKSYYSNGVLETIRTQTANGEVVHSFAPNGNLTGIDYDNGKKSICFEERFYSVKEEIAPNIYKTTFFNKDGQIDVSIANDKLKTEKTAYYEKEGYLVSYAEYGPNDSRMYMEFDKSGNLIAVE